MDIDGKTVSKLIREKIKNEVKRLDGRSPCLVVILVGDHPASHIYTAHKVKACKEAGIKSELVKLSSTISEQELLDQIQILNQAPEVDGILVQLPLPPQINEALIAKTVDPCKDVDGFHPTNLGKLLCGANDGFTPCTPLGIQRLFEHYQVETAGKHAVIVGRSNIVGKPMAALLMQPSSSGNATVTVANSLTRNLAEITRQADILITAVGKPKLITRSMVKEEAVVVDVGISRLEDRSLVGDVDYDNLKEHCRLITPVPGGVGPMTIAMLLENTLKSYYSRV